MMTVLTETREETRTMNLLDYHWVLINSSAGKDSQVMLDEVVRLADEQGFPRDQIVVVHADLGEVEWPGTKALARKQAEHYGLRFEVEKRENDDLLAYAERRGKWPDSVTRWCTSDFKRAPISRLYTKLTDEMREREPTVFHRKFRWKRHVIMGQPHGKRYKGYYGQKVKILNCLGFRAQESSNRKKKPVFEIEKGRQSPFRVVATWLPIHTWLVEEVWDRIRDSGVPYHWAYDRGMSRLSCRFCIFAPKSQLILSAQQPENQELFEKYLATEKKIGHRFKNDHSLQDVADAIACGEKVEDDDGNWNM
jgi:3'-phosphoadenosine 5'-phosphosulfate sulfotransferase (PAPS reductase)/FAD synthetase